MTHQITTNNKNWCFVEVPERSWCHSIDRGMLTAVHLAKTKKIADLPPGNWRIHSDSLNMTEELAGEVVEVKYIAYGHKVWQIYDRKTRSGYVNPVLSLHSLAKSLNITGRYIILESI